MRTLHLWNRQDLKDLARGVPFDIKVGGEVHTIQAEHAYKVKPTNGNGHEAAKNEQRRQHSEQFKREAVQRFRQAKKQGKTGQEVADELDLSRSLLTTWAKKFKVAK